MVVRIPKARFFYDKKNNGLISDPGHCFRAVARGGACGGNGLCAGSCCSCGRAECRNSNPPHPCESEDHCELRQLPRAVRHLFYGGKVREHLLRPEPCRLRQYQGCTPSGEGQYHQPPPNGLFAYCIDSVGESGYGADLSAEYGDPGLLA